MNESLAPQAAPVPACDLSTPRPDQIVLWGVNDDGSCRCPKRFDCPIKNRGKHPKVGVGGALLLFEPGDNLGNLTGKEHGRIVVDVDVRSGDGWASLLSMPGFRLDDLERTRVVRTASNGGHLYFSHPGFSVGNGKLAPHVDIRGDHDVWSYVVAPGSRVVLDDGSIGTHSLEKDVEPASCPEWLLAALLQRGARANRAVSAPVPIERTHPEWSQRYAKGIEACATMPPSKADGQGGTALFNLALRLVRTLELPLETARDLIEEHFNPRCTTADGFTPYPWTAADIDHKLEDARDKSDSPIGPPIDTKAAIQALKKRIASQPERYVPPKLTDTGNAELFVQLHGQDVRYVPTWSTWLVWDDKRWNVDELDDVTRRAKDVAATRWKFVDEYGTDADNRAKLSKWAHSSESKKARDNTIALARSEEGIPVGHGALDQDPWLLNVANGTIDLRTGELRPHRREEMHTKLVPVAFDPAASCPLWLSFLDKVTAGKNELVSFLARAIGYSLTGNVGEQALFFLQGAGANGKSTLTLIVRELLGDYAKQAAPDLLLAKQNEGHPTAIADLHGARFVLCQEVDQGRRWAEATLKQLTGGDRVKARRMQEDFWEFAPSHKLWVCANHRPQVRGADEGIWRRIKLIPFSVTIPERERDPKLVDKLRAELPGILAWAVRGCLAWQSEGLGVPEEIRNATKAYRAEEDRVGAFLDECCERKETHEVTKKALFEAYRLWAHAASEECISKRDFGERIAGHGFVGDKTGAKGHFWKGVRVQQGRVPHLASVG